MNTVYAILLFYFGATCFSFYDLIGLRLPKKESILGRSHCDYCLHELKFKDVIPIFGYIFNFGKCQYCKKKIGICHLFFELMGGTLFALSYLLYGFEIELFVILITMSVLFILSISDIYYKIVIDRIWLIGLLLLSIIRIIDRTFFIHLFSAIMMFSILFIFGYVSSKWLKREALGGGDVKLYLFIGFVIPFKEALLSLFLAALIGLIYGLLRKKTVNLEIPLVPFISIGVLIALLYGNTIIDLYLKLLGVSNV